MKIKINNEEVVCDKNFTVSEEMLATSSVTLNNVYPKSWEETKDYVSNFYYPKDYSICKIYDETIIPYEPGTEVSGNPLYLTDIVASKIYQYKLYGYTKQNTYTGKNLFDINASLYSGTITKYNNGFTLIKGTNRTLSIMLPKPIQAGTYTINSNVITNTLSNINRMYIDFRTSSSSIYATTLNANGTKTFTLPSEVDRMYVYINNSEENTATITLDNVMISTNGGDYEPYVGGQPSPNPDYPQEVEVGKGKNILNTNTTNMITTPTSYTINYDGYLVLNGTGGQPSNVYWNNFTVSETGTYAFSRTVQNYEILSSNNMFVILQVLNNGSWSSKKEISCAGNEFAYSSVSLNKGETYRFRLYTTDSNTFENTIVKVQLEKGSATSYLPYNTIEVKSTGKNLLKNISETQTINGVTFTVNDDGTISVSGTASSTAYLTYPTFSLSAGTYTLSAGIYVNQLTRIQLVEDITGRPLLASTQSAASQTFTTTATKSVFLQFRINSGEVINTTFKPMLEKSSTATEYEPYKETSIQYKLGDNFVADKDYIENGVLHKKIGKVVLDGADTGIKAISSWDATALSGSYQASFSNLLTKKTSTEYVIMSDHFGKALLSDRTTKTNIIYTYTDGIVRIATNVATTKADFLTWLSSHPVTIYYELAEETTVDLETEGELSLYDGINNVSADTDFTIDMLYNRVNGETIEDIIFNGLVKRTGNISLNPRDPHYCSLQVLDFKTFLSEGDVLNFVIANKTIEQAINMVVKAISSYGFVVGNIELDAKDDIIGAYSTDEKTAYDVFQYIADITNAKWFTRMIDEETIAIDFYDTDKLPNKGLIEYTNEWFCQNKIDDMSYSMDTNDYRNKQIILSDEVFGSTDYNETITATGYTTQFLTGGKIAKLNGATINSQTATIATNEEKEAGIEADIYYTPGENQFETAETQAQGIVIEVSYTPLVKGREIVVNNEEVDRISSQLNRNGVISRYENRNDTTSSSELQQIGQSYIKYKGSPEITLKIVSRSNLYNVGDQVTFSSPLAELSTEYMVKKKSINYIATQSIIWYTFELSSNYNSESAINYFDNQRAKRAGNISESDYIIREIDINNSAQIKWQNTTITETTITGDNVLNAPLNAPLTQ